MVGMRDNNDKPDNFGFQKSARLAALRREKEESKSVMPLEPDFPFVMIPFPAAFFGAVPSHFDNPPKDEP